MAQPAVFFREIARDVRGLGERTEDRLLQPGVPSYRGEENTQAGLLVTTVRRSGCLTACANARPQ